MASAPQQKRTRRAADDRDEMLDRVFERLADADERTRKLTREHPVAAMTIAVAIGFTAGRIAARYF